MWASASSEKLTQKRAENSANDRRRGSMIRPKLRYHSARRKPLGLTDFRYVDGCRSDTNYRSRVKMVRRLAALPRERSCFLTPRIGLDHHSRSRALRTSASSPRSLSPRVVSALAQSSRASCPHAARMSLPRERRTLTMVGLRSSSARAKAFTRSSLGARNAAPG